MRRRYLLTFSITSFYRQKGSKQVYLFLFLILLTYCKQLTISSYLTKCVQITFKLHLVSLLTHRVETAR